MENKKVEIRNRIRDYLFILVGSVILSLGLVFFLIPNKIATGGVAGLSIVLHYLFNLPAGILMLAINIPLLILGFREIGRQFVLRSLASFVALSFFTDFFTQNLHLEALSHNLMLATLYGGVLIGFGLGFVFKGNASAGGGTLVARVIANRTRFKTGQILFVMDLSVISIAGFAFQNVELALWGFITIFIASQLVDVILTGKPYAKVLQIVTTQADEIGEHIIADLGRTATILDSRGLYSGENKNLILVVLEANQILRLRDIVKLHDPDAFMIVMDAREILGKGF